MTVKINDGDLPIESAVVRICVLPKSYEGRNLLSAYEIIQTIALVSLVVKLLKNDKKEIAITLVGDLLFLFKIYS